MSNDWYSASLSEVEAFLDQYTDTDEVSVAIDSDLVAALIGLLNAAAINHVAAQHVLGAATALHALNPAER